MGLPDPRPWFTRWRSEFAIFGGFVLLTILMTWPWILHVKDHASDAGDPYLVSWILWWDFHQTFHDPLHLFDGNIFFPYKYSLAFSEHCYGLALPFFPLFALGMAPLTVHSLATLLGFTLCGYGAFRLARTLTGSAGAGWVCGVAFAFVPYRFGHLPHLPYLASGWIPLVLEALVLFVRQRSWRRAAWLGAAFFFNAISCIHWFVLTLVPLGVTGILAALRERCEKDSALWRRGAVALGIAGIALLPFLVPYQRAAKLYKFVRSADEALVYSAKPQDWLSSDSRSKLWMDFHEDPTPWERALFPGLLLFLMPLAAVLLAPVTRPLEDASVADAGGKPAPRALLLSLDILAVAATTVALLASSVQGLHLQVFRGVNFDAASSARAVAVVVVALLVRWWFAYPMAFGSPGNRNLRESLRRRSRPDALVVGFLWALLGFFGSLGLRFPYYRALFDLVPLYRSIRAPVRSAMVAYLGLALLAGLGAKLLAERADGLRSRWPKFRHGSALVFGLVVAALLFELRAAPLDLVRGEARPDEVTLRLKATPMRGGIVDISNDGGPGVYLAVLRAADHAKPLVTGVSGFIPPVVARLGELLSQKPIPDELFDLLDSIPASYLVVHEATLDVREREMLHDFLGRGLKAGRLSFVRRFDGEARNDLYAVTKTEPEARSEQPMPWAWKGGTALDAAHDDPALVGGFDEPVEGSIVRGDLTLKGWARVAGEDLGVTLLIDGEFREPATFRRTPRRDVQGVLPALGDCGGAGWEARYAFSPKDEGPHGVTAIFTTQDGRFRHYPPRRFNWRGVSSPLR
jgi:hypothetical protein